jgi:hypothetical protein
MSPWEARLVGVVSGVVAAGFAQVELMREVPVPQRTAILGVVEIFAMARWRRVVRIACDFGCLVRKPLEVFFI